MKSDITRYPPLGIGNDLLTSAKCRSTGVLLVSQESIALVSAVRIPTRVLFEEESESAGGEVKITQASRDGGVDAVAFDPDPIRGGKIVIQAKRYTNTVGVSAVRDLYAVVVHEGAIKGILVTASGFGSDSYELHLMHRAC